MILFRRAVLLSFSVFLSACGGGSSSSVAEIIDPDPDPGPGTSGQVEILPFNLKDNDGEIAFSFGFLASVFRSATPSAPILVELTENNQPVEPGDQNPVVYIDVTEPRCSTGSIDYADSTPPPPIRFNDIGWEVDNTVVLSAGNCAITTNANTSLEARGNFFSGVVRTQYSNVLSSTSEYSDYVYSDFGLNNSDLDDFDPDEYRNNQISMTGNNSFTITGNVSQGGEEVSVAARHDEYKHISGDTAIVRGLVYKSIRTDEGTTVKTFNYNATWEMGDTDSGERLIRTFPLSSLVTAPDNTIGSVDRIFPKGRYELDVNVSSPLVFSGGLMPSAGIVKVHLISHNILADIEYEEDYAIVNYNRSGVIKRIRINSDLTVRDINP